MKFNEIFNFEKKEKKESIPEVNSRILLHITRHGEKEKRPDRNNYEQELTDKGKKQAIEKGKNQTPASDASLAYGSNIIRSQQEGGFEMAGATQRDDISGIETLEELKEKLDMVDGKKLNYGSRIGEDKRLGFFYETPELEDMVNEAYNNNQGLKWNVEESDKKAKELGDKSSTTYLRAAANFAEVVDKYVKVSKNFSKLIENEDNKEKYGKQLERFLGTHAGALDLFLCRVVEKIKGKDERDNLISVLGNQGVEYNEGFDITIDDVQGKSEPEVKIFYEKKNDKGEITYSFKENIPLASIEEIIKENN